MPPPASTAADARQTFAAPVASSPTETASSAAPVDAASSASLRLDVHAPPLARAGDVVTITIDAEALVGIRDLSFTVIYEGGVLELESSSPGSFVQQASAPATLSAEDPSTGNVLVNMEVTNDGRAAAAGTVVVLKFNALRAGTSPITLRDVSFLEGGRSRSSTSAVVRPASVTVEQR